MHTIHAELALLPEGWRRDVRVGIDGDRIARVTPGSTAAPEETRVEALLPGMPNLHSHAFQRGMSGLAEVPGPSEDSFWTWREVMYRFALAMTPDQLEAIATWLYIELLEAGFTRVGEFHYLHHDRDGSPYADPAEMATRIAAAAVTSGIGLTLLPVFYAHGDFGGQPPTDGQRRFLTDLDDYARLHKASRAAVAGLDGVAVGVAPHSLRAVTPAELEVVAGLAPDAPVHIHVAEQAREVEGCLAWSGQRPVEWLLDHAGVDARWCLIHATHMTPGETRRLAESGAVAGLCPVTEANLGDGIFPGRASLTAGGRYGIGTDSNIAIGVPAELRQLEYSQRLALQARNVMTQDGPTGRSLYLDALHGGSQALGVSQNGIAPGAPADLVALGDALLDTDDGDALLNRWVFGQGVGVDRVWVAGRQVVEDRRHIGRDAALDRFRVAMRDLADCA